MDLIEQMKTQIGLSGDQAEGATGAILNFAKQNLGEGEFQSVVNEIPGASQMMDQAPGEEEAGGGGLMGSIGGMASSLGGSLGKLGGLASLTGILSKLGIGTESLGKVFSMFTGFLQGKGLSDIATKLGGMFGKAE